MISRVSLIRVWVEKYEAGALDEIRSILINVAEQLRFGVFIRANDLPRIIDAKCVSVDAQRVADGGIGAVLVKEANVMILTVGFGNNAQKRDAGTQRKNRSHRSSCFAGHIRISQKTPFGHHASAKEQFSGSFISNPPS